MLCNSGLLVLILEKQHGVCSIYFVMPLVGCGLHSNGVCSIYFVMPLVGCGLHSIFKCIDISVIKCMDNGSLY